MQSQRIKQSPCLNSVDMIRWLWLGTTPIQVDKQGKFIQIHVNQYIQASFCTGRGKGQQKQKETNSLCWNESVTICPRNSSLAQNPKTPKPQLQINNPKLWRRVCLTPVGLESTWSIALLPPCCCLFYQKIIIPSSPTLFDVALLGIRQQVTITDQEMKVIVMVTGTVSGILGEALLVMKTVSVGSLGCDFLR